MGVRIALFLAASSPAFVIEKRLRRSLGMRQGIAIVCSMFYMMKSGYRSRTTELPVAVLEA